MQPYEIDPRNIPSRFIPNVRVKGDPKAGDRGADGGDEFYGTPGGSDYKPGPGSTPGPKPPNGKPVLREDDSVGIPTNLRVIEQRPRIDQTGKVVTDVVIGYDAVPGAIGYDWLLSHSKW